MSLTIRQVVNRFNEHSPNNESQVLRSCAVSLRYLGEGAFRIAFQVNDLPLILKVPKTDCYSDLEHAYQEWSHVRKIENTLALAPLRPYVPKIYYFNHEHGLALVHQYKMLKGRGATAKRRTLDKLVRKVLQQTASPDVKSCDNVGVDENGQLKFIDMGQFGWTAWD